MSNSIQEQEEFSTVLVIFCPAWDAPKAKLTINKMMFASSLELAIAQIKQDDFDYLWEEGFLYSDQHKWRRTSIEVFVPHSQPLIDSEQKHSGCIVCSYRPVK